MNQQQQLKSKWIFNLFTLDKPYLQKEGLFKALPKSILRYIFENAKVDHWKKLYETCKYFYYIFPHVIVDTLKDSEDFTRTKKYYLNYSPKYENVHNFWLCDTVRFNRNSFIIPEIISRVSICNIRILQFISVSLNMAELEFLTKSKKVEEIDFQCTKLINQYNGMAPIEDMISYFPNAYSIEIDEALTSDDTSIKLYSLQRTRKLKDLRLLGIDGQLNTRLFFQFLMKNAAIDSYCIIEFDDAGYSEAFEDALRMELNKINWSDMLESKQHMSISDSDPERNFREFRKLLIRCEKIEKKAEEMRKANLNKIYDKFRYFIDGIENPLVPQIYAKNNGCCSDEKVEDENEIYESFRRFLLRNPYPDFLKTPLISQFSGESKDSPKMDSSSSSSITMPLESKNKGLSSSTPIAGKNNQKLYFEYKQTDKQHIDNFYRAHGDLIIHPHVNYYPIVLRKASSIPKINERTCAHCKAVLVNQKYVLTHFEKFYLNKLEEKNAIRTICASLVCVNAHFPYFKFIKFDPDEVTREEAAAIKKVISRK